mmetsp:Transcript_24074/g.25102  ORF Transcript_24074/g.25102 Transcript_24074/m.25102 type:complete len:86 (+) Transcript_24074:196-453(+)
MKKTNKRRINTFPKACKDHFRVCNSCSSPFRDLTSLNTLVILNTLNTLRIWKDFRKAALDSVKLEISISIILVMTTKKSNLFQPS